MNQVNYDVLHTKGANSDHVYLTNIVFMVGRNYILGLRNLNKWVVSSF